MGRLVDLGRGDGGVLSLFDSASCSGGGERLTVFAFEVVLSEIETEREGGFEGARAGEADGDEDTFAEEDDAGALADAEELAPSRWARDEGRAGRG